MPNCPRCGKPVYFAERKTSLGKDWHPQCLRCENCDKSLTPGKHSEHLGKPYCNTCYQSLYGPEGYRFGCVEPRKVKMEQDTQSASEKQEILSKIREYNLYKRSPQEKLKTREANGVVLFEGVLKLYWGLKKAVTLPPGSTYAKQRYNRDSIYDLIGDEASYILLIEEAQKARSRRELFESERRRLKEIVENSIQLSEEQRSADLQDLSVSYSDNYNPMSPTNCDPMNYDPMNSTHSLPASIRNRPPLESSQSVVENEEQGSGETFTGDTNSLPRSRKRQSTVYDRSRSGSVVMRKRSASFRKISRAKKLEESKDVSVALRSQFTPPFGSSTNIRVGSTLKTRDVMQLLMNKFKVENDISQFALYIVYDNGAQEVCKEEDCPLLLRLKLGPSEEIAKLFVMEAVDAERTQLSAEAAEWIKFAIPELEIFCKKYEEEEGREVEKLRQRFLPWRRQLADQINEMRESNRVFHETDI